MLVVGLTGGIGSGKTTVARLFAKRDIPVIDADEIARKLVTPGSPASQEIAATFGNDLFNEHGELDRAALRDIVFNDSAKKRQLEDILHPRVRLSIQNELRKLNSCYCIVVVPLLLEGDMGKIMDRILVIDCTEEQQVDRVMQRSGLRVSEIHAIMAAQASRQERLGAADDVLDNTGTDDTLNKRVEALHQQYLGLCQAG